MGVTLDEDGDHGVKLTDEFKGSDEQLMASARSLLCLNAKQALTPTGFGGNGSHVVEIMSSLIVRYEAELRARTLADKPAKPGECGDERWPHTGAEVGNIWYKHPAAFLEMMARYAGFWTADYAVKYVGVRVDTRDPTRFVLFDRDGEQISANRVLDAIEVSKRLRVNLHVSHDGSLVLSTTKVEQ